MKVNTNKKNKLLDGVGPRLKKIRSSRHFTRAEMAAKLGISPASYTRNENGSNTPGFISLHVLQQEFNISLDWLLFGHGPMYFSDKQPQPAEKPPSTTETLAADIEKMPEIETMIKDISQNEKIRYKVLAYYYSCLGDEKT